MSTPKQKFMERRLLDLLKSPAWWLPKRKSPYDYFKAGYEAGEANALKEVEKIRQSIFAEMKGE